MIEEGRRFFTGVLLVVVSQQVQLDPHTVCHMLRVLYSQIFLAENLPSPHLHFSPSSYPHNLLLKNYSPQTQQKECIRQKKDGHETVVIY